MHLEIDLSLWVLFIKLGKNIKIMVEGEPMTLQHQSPAGC